jgi:NAD(P)-dependent dehydrogenase (short-subunit alcohol dehydrogenase family)
MAFDYRAPGTTKLACGADFVQNIHNDTYDYIKPEQFDLKDRAVLITGASKGIGRETALSYARAGTTKIAVAARSPLESLVKEIILAAQNASRPAPQVLALSVDVADYSSVEKAASQVEREFGRLDILINNAGSLCILLCL